MKISNLRIVRKDNFSYLTVDVNCSFSNNHELWLSVPCEYENWFSTDVYDAFLVSAIYPAMYYNEPIEIEGNVSPRLLFNVKNYVRYAIKAYRDDMHFVDISVAGTAIAKQANEHVATGFAGGIDSFTTIIDRLEEEKNPTRQLDTFMCFNVGSHGGGKSGARELFKNRYELLKGFPEEKNIPYIKVDSNLYDFYKNEWEYYAGTFTRCFAILAFQRAVRYYYLSGEFSYREHMDNHFDKQLCNIDEMTELYMLSLLSTERTEIILEGAQYTRMEKTVKVANYEPSYSYLNVCNKDGDMDVITDVSASNCSRYCLKCIRTIKALDCIGKLDNYKEVFDLSYYYANRKKLWLQYVATEYQDYDPFKKEIIEYAKLHNYAYLPSPLYVYFYKRMRNIYHIIWLCMKKLRIK